jgi:type VI secretion system secreted protein Hcp
MARPIKSVWLFLLSLLGLHGGSAFATSGVLCIGEAQGESTRQAGCIDVLAWSWGGSASYGIGGGQTNLQDISLTKYVDTASEDLLRLLVTRATIKGIVAYSEYKDDCGAGCLSTDPYLTVHFNAAQVTSFSTGNSSGGGVATENISMQFQQISYCYRPTVAGVLGTAQCTAYDKTNGTIAPF